MGSKKEIAGFQEAAQHVGATANVPGAGLHALADFAQGRGRVVGHHAAVQMPPEVFDGIQFRCVGGQPFPPQPSLSGGGLHVGLRLAALMGGQAIPQQDHWPGELAAQRLEKVHDIGAHDGAFGEAQAQPNRATGRATDQDANGRELLPVEVVHQGRRAPPGSPGAADGRPLGKAALVQKNQQRAAAPGFFLMPGQTRDFQC